MSNIKKVLTIQEVLGEIQKELKVPKNQLNKFGGYNYRSCEDIVEAVNRLKPQQSCLLLSDEVVSIDGHLFVKATATFCIDDQKISTTALAKHPLQKKGMDDAQITGSTSSYARKYALNGLFAIDDTKDADTMDNSKKDDGYENLKCEMMVLIDRCNCGDDLNNMIEELKDAKHVRDSKTVLFSYLKEKAETIGYLFNSNSKRFEHE